jgi:hypothetical protein
MTRNEQIIKAFADQFEPPLKYAQTLKVNNVSMPDAWQCSYWNNAKGVGVMAVVYSGQIHAYVEAAGRAEIAADAGKACAAALKAILDTPEAEANGTT